MILTVIKRDGLKVPFDQNRIKLAIEAAMKNTKKGVDEELASSIAASVGSKGSGERSVEDIQDSVEKALMKSSRKDVAKEYIQYRHRRDVARKSKTYDMFSEIVAAKENEVTRENANMNSDSPAGQMMKFASETTKPFVDDYLLSEDVREAVDANYIHIHDKDYYPTKSLTCLQHPLNIIFKKGFRAGHGELRPPKRIETAATQACVSMETVQNEMHGGQAIPAFDFYLAPFVRSCYQEELDRIAELLSDIPDPKFWDELKNAEIEDYVKRDLPQVKAVPAAGSWVTYPGRERIKQEAINRTVDRVHQAMEAFVHNMNNIHSRGGNQVVFSSINYGTDTSAEGRCIIREILRATEAGVGNGATAIFPIQIWKLKAGVSYLPGDPNYDLYKYACKVTARRFFPNFLNLDASYNRSPEWNASDKKRYIHEVATMGALAGKEHIYVKIGNGEPIDISIKDFYEYCKTGELKEARPCQIFCNKELLERVVGDRTKQTKGSGILREAGVYAITYIPEDVTYIGSSPNINRRINEHKCSIRLTGRMDSGINFADRNVDNYRFEVLEYTEDYKEAEKKYIETVPNGNIKGTSQKYYKAVTAHFKKTLRVRPNFEQDLTVMQDLISLEDRDIKVFDRDGQWTKIKHVFKNDKRNTPRMMHIFYSEYGRSYCLDCTEDHPLFTGAGFTRADQILAGDSIYRMDGLELKVEDVCYSTYSVDSYDLGTVTGTFIGSDIIMHNCRTRVWSDKFGTSTSVGRGNLSFTTVNLPKLALEAAIESGVYKKAESGEWVRSENVTEDQKDNAIQCFYEKLENYLDLTAKQLDERYRFQATAKAKQFPLLMSGLWVGSEKLGPEDSVEPVIKHGTLGVGFIGLAEALVALTGKHHGESKESQNLGLNIVSFIDKRCKDYSKEYDHNYSCFATPAEGLSGKFTRKDQKEFGKVKGVMDREYYTNSSHVPVYYPISFKDKIEIEGPYHKFEPAGHIAYVEVDGSVVKNPEAVMDIVDLMVKNDVGYGSINFNCSRCEDCGYESSDEFKDGVCPKCGSTRTTYLQRITGYLVGTTNRWNGGKKAELRDRVTHVGHRDTNVEMIYGHNSENS